MKKVLYVSTVCNLIYVMVYTRPNIVYAVGIISRFFANSDKEY